MILAKGNFKSGELGDLKPLSLGKFGFQALSGIQGQESHLRRGGRIYSTAGTERSRGVFHDIFRPPHG